MSSGAFEINIPEGLYWFGEIVTTGYIPGGVDRAMNIFKVWRRNTDLYVSKNVSGYSLTVTSATINGSKLQVQTTGNNDLVVATVFNYG